MTDEERSCPHCSGVIKAAAKICKHCKRDAGASTAAVVEHVMQICQICGEAPGTAPCPHWGSRPTAPEPVAAQVPGLGLPFGAATIAVATTGALALLALGILRSTPLGKMYELETDELFSIAARNQNLAQVFLALASLAAISSAAIPPPFRAINAAEGPVAVRRKILVHLLICFLSAPFFVLIGYAFAGFDHRIFSDLSQRCWWWTASLFVPIAIAATRQIVWGVRLLSVDPEMMAERSLRRRGLSAGQAQTTQRIQLNGARATALRRQQYLQSVHATSPDSPAVQEAEQAVEQALRAVTSLEVALSTPVSTADAAQLRELQRALSEKRKHLRVLAASAPADVLADARAAIDALRARFGELARQVAPSNQGPPLSDSFLYWVAPCMVAFYAFSIWIFMAIERYTRIGCLPWQC